MKESYRIALHIGLPKTATTSLQKNLLYPAHLQGKINFLGRSGESFEQDFYYPFESIFTRLDEPCMSEYQVALLRKELVKILKSDAVNVISEESLSLTHGFQYVRLENLKRVLSVFDVKVLLSLRTPVDFFYSYYAELFPTVYVRDEQLNTIDKFASKVVNNPSNKDFDIVRSDIFLFHIRALFSDVNILLFEDLKHDREAYTSDVSKFFQLEYGFVKEYLFSKELNKGIHSTGGKYSRKVSLLDSFQRVKEQLIGKTKLHRLKQYSVIYAVYTKFLRFLRNVPHTNTVEHRPLALNMLRYLKACISMKRVWMEEIEVDAHKLELYGYTKGRMQENNIELSVSVCLITYNHENYIEDALNSVLHQTYDDMEIVVSDDDSSDRTVEKIRENLKVASLYNVKLRPQTPNLGINAHVNAVSKLASGRLIIIASGDDLSMPYRVERIVERWQMGAVGIFSNAEVIDSDGHHKGLFKQEGYEAFTNWKEMVNAGCHGVWGSTFAWDRKIFEIFGSLPTNILGEDAIIPFRCALLGKVEYIDEPLVQYRDHGGNISFWAQRKKASGKSLRQLGEEVIQYNLVMYQNWRKDIQIAYSAGYLTKKDVEWAEASLRIHETCYSEQLKVLNSSYWRAFLIMLNALRNRQSLENRRGWFKSLMGIFLRYRMPALFKFLCFVRGSV